MILDPPGFARTKSGRFSAGRDYGKLAALAAEVTPPGGHVLACCNVAELTWRSYRTQLLAGITAAGRTGEIEGVYHEPAIDFPVAAGREPYLKIALLRLG